MNTGGAVRGLVGRWLMRIEAAESLIRSAFLAITAASTLTSALALIGAADLAPYILGAGLVSTPAFAYVYVEYGTYNRKNRERIDRGDNFAAAPMAMGMTLQGRQRAVMAQAIEHDWSWEHTMEVMDRVTSEALSEYRDGIDPEQVFERQEPPVGRPARPAHADGGERQ